VLTARWSWCTRCTRGSWCTGGSWRTRCTRGSDWYTGIVEDGTHGWL